LKEPELAEAILGFGSIGPNILLSHNWVKWGYRLSGLVYSGFSCAVATFFQQAVDMEVTVQGMLAVAFNIVIKNRVIS
jgi:hypothetical protein